MRGLALHHAGPQDTGSGPPLSLIFVRSNCFLCTVFITTMPITSLLCHILPIVHDTNAVCRLPGGLLVQMRKESPPTSACALFFSFDSWDFVKEEAWEGALPPTWSPIYARFCMFLVLAERRRYLLPSFGYGTVSSDYFLEQAVVDYKRKRSWCWFAYGNGTQIKVEYVEVEPL